MERPGWWFRHLVESSPDGIWAMDVTGRTLYVNPRAAELLGRSVSELTELTVFDVLDAQGKQQFAAHLRKSAREGADPKEVECAYIGKDGGYVRLLVNEGPILDETGTPIGFVHRLASDERRQLLAAEASRSRALLDEAQATANIGSWEVDLRTGGITWSRQMFLMFGLDPESFPPSGVAFDERLVGDGRAVVDHAIRSAVADGAPGYDYDVQMRRGDGTVGWFRGQARLAYGDTGAPVRVSGTLQDITDVKDVETQLLDAVLLNALLQVLVTAANSAGTVAEALTAIRMHLLGHEDWLRAVGFTVVGDAHDQLRPFLADEPQHVPDDSDWDVAHRVLETRDIVMEERTRPETPSVGLLLELDGAPLVVVVLTSTSPFRRPWMVRALVSQVADQLNRVAERERDAAQLAAARDAAMEASRLKSRFLAMMSHEIRTPMNGVIGLNELLLGTELDENQRRLALGVQSAGRSLLGLINDILDFSKIEAGQLELEQVEFDVRPLLEQLVTVARPAAPPGVTVSLDVAPDVPDRVVGDPTRFGQVVSNLLSNAVKFTPTGRVDVRVAQATAQATDETTVQATDEATEQPRRPARDDAITLLVEVEDTGIGIDPGQATQLFEPFRQADVSTTRTHGGTGLGLAIARQLCHALGGRIDVDTVPGRGSRFWFTGRFGGVQPGSPGSRAERPPAAEVEVPSRRRRGQGRVLVVEDNDVNQLVAVGLLETLGYTAEVVPNGAQAVARAAETEYDAVLMDLQMPVMDGFTASRRIRAGERGRRVPIIAMTASAITGERERCLDAGMDDFLSKPVNAERLAAMLRTHVGSGARPRGDSPAQESRAPGAAAPDPTDPAPAPLDPHRLDELLAMGERAVPLVDRAISNFLSNLDPSVREIDDAVGAGDFERLRTTAHRLRGSALNLGAGAVAEVGLALELRGDEGDLTDAPALVDRLRRVGKDTVAALAAYRSRVLAKAPGS